MTGQIVIRYHRALLVAALNSPGKATRAVKRFEIFQPQIILWLILFMYKTVFEKMIRWLNNAAEDGGRSRD